MPVRLTGSTSGYTELTAPAVAGSNTLTLPTGNGTSGQFLQTDGSGTLSWGSQRILQVVSANSTTQYSNATTTFSDTFSASITPSSASNKVLVLAYISVQSRPSGATVTIPTTRLLRDSTTLQTYGYAGYVAGNTVSGTYISPIYLDSPSTTSSTTYKIQLALGSGSNGGTIYVNYSDAGGTQISTLTLLEVAA